MIYDLLTKAVEAKDVAAWSALFSDDFEFVRHKSGTSLNKTQSVEMMKQFMASDKVVEHSRRCIYENEDILVIHSVMDFADNTREAIIAVYTIKDGLIVASETGATLLS